ncbi:trypsin eta-like [Musca domestica]|uniref:Trypsin eta-like n=1 Tax=Musca domestica TaxID=7370 RepID=A0ABM3VG58_MUSDO|nr:trypsin eta-like [Musca domestica]
MFRLAVLLLAIVAAGIEAAAPLTNTGRIIGGREVTIAKHPHQVSLRYKSCDECTFLHGCGGVIYNANTILTAAHCVHKREVHEFIVVAGTDNRSGSDGIVALVERIVLHENYNPALTENDVALLHLATPIVLNGVNIDAAVLAKQPTKIGATALVTGWGTTSEGGMNSLKLQEAEVKVIDHEVCNDAYGFGRITEDMLCAGVVGGGRDACQNDSGGPLISNDTLIGIVSWGTGCARPEYPGVYANVAYFRSWIETNAKGN